MFFLSLFVPEGAPPLSRELIEQPHLARYHRGWGRDSDAGVVALWRGEPVGTAWSRFFAKDDPGYGFVNERTPEVGIALAPDHRGRGIGTALLGRLFDVLIERGISAVSLSVDRRNRALALYERLGFSRWREDGHAITMLNTLE